MGKNIYSISATLLRNSIYNEGRKAAEYNKLPSTCPYDKNKRVSRDVWFMGYDNYKLEADLEHKSYLLLN